MRSAKMSALEEKFENLKKNEGVERRYNESLNHTDQVLTDTIQSTREYAVRNKQYSCKTNVSIFGFQQE